MRSFTGRVVSTIAVVAVAASAASAQQIPDRATLNAILGGNQTLEDFESYNIGDENAENLGVFSLDDSTIANGQGPNLVEPGARYFDPSQSQLQWNGNNYFGLQTRTLLSNGATGEISIEYTTAVHAMGIDLRGFQGFGWSGTAQVFDLSGNLISTTNVSISNGGAENLFFGWQHNAGIGMVTFDSNTHSWSPIIDNHGYGPVPAPAAGMILALGLIRGRRRRD